MFKRKKYLSARIALLLLIFFGALLSGLTGTYELKFTHNHTSAEVADYLRDLAQNHANICRLHRIGKSYLGKDLLVLEITNQTNGKALDKPGFWIDGNIHAGEVFGAEICLKTIDTLIAGYGRVTDITKLIDTIVVYIMPQLNPDGSDHYLSNPDRMRSSVRPYDEDNDGQCDEDPAEDLNGDHHITFMRIKDELGPMKTSPDDPRLMVKRKEDEKGEWRVYQEGIDNDSDGLFNEDGVGGLDLNRNWPSGWQQEWIQPGSGPYPLSEPETRAVADFLLSHRNITGVINHHMAGNFVYRPPSFAHFDPLTGEEEPFLPEDETLYQIFGRKYQQILKNQPVYIIYKGLRPSWGLMLDWAYDHYGVFSWVPEVGEYPRDYDKDGKVTELERIRYNDEELGGKGFIDWKAFDHPQLGEVEIGGIIGKIYDPDLKSYTNVRCLPGTEYEEFLAKHTKWNLYLIAMSPWVRILHVNVKPVGPDMFKISAAIQNQGFLPTNVTQQAIRNQTAKTVKVALTLTGAQLLAGSLKSDLGHLPGNTPPIPTPAKTFLPSPIKMIDWIVQTTGKGKAEVLIQSISEKGGTDSRQIILKE